MPTHRAGVHLSLQEGRRSPHQGLQRQRHLGRRRGAQPRYLSQQSEQFGLPRRQPEDRADHGFDPDPPDAGAAQRGLEGLGQVGGAARDDRLEHGVLGGEPVEDALLGELEALGQGIQRGGVVAAGGKRGQGGVEDAVARRWVGFPSGPPRRSPVGGSAWPDLVVVLTYQMVDRFGDGW